MTLSPDVEAHLRGYHGRGFVLGSDSHRKLIQAYWLTGRSDASRNRLLRCSGDCVDVLALNPLLTQDSSLLFYTAMKRLGDYHLVANGDHLGLLEATLLGGHHIAHALHGMAHEPDAPHFTARIFGLLKTGSDTGYLGIARQDVFHPEGHTRRDYFERHLPPGMGYGLTTYRGDGHPLPPLDREPFPLPLHGTLLDMADALMASLSEDHFIALVIKEISPDGKVRVILKNKQSPQEAPDDTRH